MKKIIMTICASENSFGAYSENYEGIWAAGDTVEECKEDVAKAIELIKENLPEDQWPDAIKGEYEIEWRYDKKRVTMYQQMDDIFDAITWGDLARTYFDKSASWFYNKMKGIDGNGKPTEFSREERIQFKGALCDLADRIRKAADTIDLGEGE